MHSYNAFSCTHMICHTMPMSSLPTTLQWVILQYAGSVHRFDPRRARLHWDIKRAVRSYQERAYKTLQRVWNPLQPMRPVAFYRVSRWCLYCGEYHDGFHCQNCGAECAIEVYPKHTQRRRALRWV